MVWSRARRPEAVLGLVVLLAGACVGQSSLSGGTAGRDQPGAVPISERLLRADGSPAAGVTVFLSRRPGVAEGLFGLIADGLTFGLACTGDQPLAICDGGARTVTDGNGHYDFTSGTGAPERLSLFAQLPAQPGQASGPGLAADFPVATGGAALPPVRFWDPALDLRSVPGGAQLAWGELDAGSPPRYRAVFGDGAAGAVLSLQTGARFVSFDARLLEDSRGAVAVTASSRVGGGDGEVTVTYTSAGRPYEGGAGVPVSRGRPWPGRAPAPSPTGTSPTSRRRRSPPSWSPTWAGPAGWAWPWCGGRARPARWSRRRTGRRGAPWRAGRWTCPASASSGLRPQPVVAGGPGAGATGPGWHRLPSRGVAVGGAGRGRGRRRERAGDGAGRPRPGPGGGRRAGTRRGGGRGPGRLAARNRAGLGATLAGLAVAVMQVSRRRAWPGG